MSTAHAIARLGFQKWYERELLRSHANLVLLLLATLGLLGAAELYQASLPLLQQLELLGVGAASAAIGLVALRRYLYRLNHAEYVADQAVCKGCDTYAKLEVLDGTAASSVLHVRCRRCDHRWTLQL
ncbi:hypothetical protein HLB44_10010 [Aquincola sp. S2]|uniref:Uncharacterized protein n=1 Tax=Pseudaquabacterium terrae TaxID=2732868 RepID=A0ABX2EFE1_9BURK|nr:hypothetical protein [Aquabacterium terrae]NRF67318.1 hypothetical protein [Aquabacterium terrae]